METTESVQPRGADKFPAPREVNWMKTRARLHPGARGGVVSIAMVHVETVDATWSITSYSPLHDLLGLDGLHKRKY